jgi:release factor glutamine methyltransferase
VITPGPDVIRRLTEAGVDNPRLDARLLWDHAQRNFAIFEGYLVRRCAREPLAYITGHKEFWSLEFLVGPGVLVPRPETETIIEQALAVLPDTSAPLRVLDLGTGTGCLLIAFLKEFRNSTGLGIDCSEEALRIAGTNLAEHHLTDRAEIRAGNWDDNLEGTWDVILSNPPYITSKDLAGLAPEVVRYEPVGALDGGPDGLAAIRKLAAAMARRLDGYGFVEIGAGQATDVTSVMAEHGLNVLQVAPDLAGIPRVMVTRSAGSKKLLE